MKQIASRINHKATKSKNKVPCSLRPFSVCQTLLSLHMCITEAYSGALNTTSIAQNAYSDTKNSFSRSFLYIVISSSKPKAKDELL